jgi:hypothetical protein
VRKLVVVTVVGVLFHDLAERRVLRGAHWAELLIGSGWRDDDAVVGDRAAEVRDGAVRVERGQERADALDIAIARRGAAQVLLELLVQRRDAGREWRSTGGPFGSEAMTKDRARRCVARGCAKCGPTVRYCAEPSAV